MKVLILSGGKSNTSKLFQVFVGKRLIDYYLNQLKDFDIHINLNKESKAKFDSKIHLEIEEKRQGNAFAIKTFAEKYQEDFICLYNDIFTTLDFNLFLKQIRKKDNDKFDAILVAKNIAKSKPNAFGIITFDKNKNVLSFTKRRYTNCGIYYFRKNIVEYIKINEDLENDVFPKLIENKKLGVFTFRGFWYRFNENKTIKYKGEKHELHIDDNSK